MDIHIDKSVVKPHNETREWAIFILFLSAIGFLLSFPCRDTFFGGLLASGFGASIVGGLTDWFAVESLFRKPFGLCFFRAMIPSKKDKIIESLATMVETDLLSLENIKKSINSYNLTLSINEILKKTATKSIIRTFLQNITIDLLKTQEHAIIASLIKNAIITNVSNVNSSSVGSILKQVAAWSEEKGYLDKILVFTLSEVKRFLSDSEFKVRLANATDAVLRDYKCKGGVKRNILIYVVDMIGKPLLVSNIQKRAIEHIEKCKNESGLRQEILSKLIAYINGLGNNSSINAYIQEMMNILRDNPDKISETIVAMISRFEEGITTDQGVAKRFLDTITSMILDILVNLCSDPQKQKVANEFLKAKILDLVSANRDQVGRLVRDRLKSYPPGELENMIEKKVGEDLQVIRFTGTLIGGLAGSLVFIINQILFLIIR